MSTNQWNDKSNVIYSYYGMLFGNKKDLSTLSTQQVVVQSFSYIQLFVTPWTAACQAFLSFTSPRICSNSCSLSQQCFPTISLSVIPICSCHQSFPASGSFPVSHLFVSGVQSIRASASAPVLPMNIQSWFPLGLTGLISLQSKELSRVLQHHSSKASILQHSTFFMVQFWHPHMLLLLLSHFGRVQLCATP